MPHKDTERRAFNEVFGDPAAALELVSQLPEPTVVGFLSALGMGDDSELASWLESIPSPLAAAGIGAILDAVASGLAVELVHRPASHFRLEVWESAVPAESGRSGTVTLLISGPSEDRGAPPNMG